VTDVLHLGPAGTIDCLLTNGQNPNPGEIDVTYPGPDFGAGTGSMTYDTPSDAASGGACFAHPGTVCVTDADCPDDDNCESTGTAYTLTYKIERL
jgi:hypothetical protein